jgi:C4-type Zn-finger protein
MALNQFGAVMTFAIDLEGKLAEFYEQAAAANSDHATELENRAKASKSRRQKIEQSRRENVTEITLEAIDGLDEADFAIDFSQHTPANIDAVEAVVQKFYREAAPKINVREARQVLERCLKEHNRLEALGS